MNQLMCSVWVMKQTRPEVSLNHLILFASSSATKRFPVCRILLNYKYFNDQACSYKRT